MKAPDKIYRSYFYDSASEVYQSHPAEDADTCTEYIRKDALLNFAKEKNARLDGTGGNYTDGYIHAMIDIIDKLESM